MQSEFGAALKSWRAQRRISQLDLGLTANVSARHISFLETGRARPSRPMVMMLAEELDVPRQARNQLLAAAGYAPAYGHRALSDKEMAPVRDAVDWMLDRHAPYPAIAMDKHWKIVRLNNTAEALMAGMGVSEGDNIVGALINNQAVRSSLENLDEIMRHTVTRLRTEIANLGGDPVLQSLIDDLSAAVPGPLPIEAGILPAFIPARYRANGMLFSLFSTITQFGSAEDIALSELKIEMMFPADDQTRTLLMRFA